jgi:DNA-binding MarR family transcriptional regulator
MKRDQLVREEADPRDRRVVRYRLTPHAHDLEPELAAAGHRVIEHAVRGIPTDELAVFRRVLDAMTDNLSTDAPATP